MEGDGAQADTVKDRAARIKRIRYIGTELYLARLSSDESACNLIKLICAVPCFDGLESAF